MPPAYLKGERVTHAQARALERYGVYLDKSDLGTIVWMVQNNKGTKLVDGKQPNGNTVWDLTYKKIKMRVVISPDFYSVCTFLMPVGPVKPPPLKLVRKKFYRNRVAKWGSALVR